MTMIKTQILLMFSIFDDCRLQPLRECSSWPARAQTRGTWTSSSPSLLKLRQKLQRTISGMSEGTPKDKEEVEQQELDSILEVEVEQQVEAEQENVFDFNDYVKPGEVRKAHKVVIYKK